MTETSNPPSQKIIYRRQSTEYKDLDYCVKVDEPADQLNFSDLWTLCEKLCENGKASVTLIRLSQYFGMSVDRNSDVKESLDKMYNMIECWTQRKGSTVRVLISALKHLQRNDCVQYVETVAVRKFTHLCIVLHVMGTSESERKAVELKYDNAPERMPFTLWIRPLVQDYICSTQPRAANRTHRLLMKRLDDLEWSSLCKQYIGRQIDLYLYSEVTNTREYRSDPTVLDDLSVEERRRGHVFEYSEPYRPCTTLIDLSLGYYKNEEEEEKTCVQESQENQETPTLCIRPELPGYNTPPNSYSGEGDSYDLEANSKDSRRKRNQKSFEEQILSESDDLVTSMSNDGDIVSLHSDYTAADTRKTGILDTIEQEKALNRSELLHLDLSSYGTNYELQSNVSSSSSGGARDSVKERDIGYFKVEKLSARSSSWDTELNEVSHIKGFHELLDVPIEQRRLAAKRKIQVHYKKYRMDGCYIIRPSQTGTQRFTLTYGYKDLVYDISIVSHSGQYCLFGRAQVTKKSIRDLIQYYKEHEINDSVKLTVPVLS